MAWLKAGVLEDRRRAPAPYNRSSAPGKRPISSSTLDVAVWYSKACCSSLVRLLGFEQSRVLDGDYGLCREGFY
jgi:hypothetical protein